MMQGRDSERHGARHRSKTRIERPAVCGTRTARRNGQTGKRLRRHFVVHAKVLVNSAANPCGLSTASAETG